MSLSTQDLIERSTLEALADQRLEDFEALLGRERFAWAIYTGIYVVEYLLKACICKTLNLDILPGVFKEHDLEKLLKFSGLEKNFLKNEQLARSFKELTSLWNPSDQSRNIRYINDTVRYDKNTAEDVGDWLTDEHRGVVPWLKTYLK